MTFEIILCFIFLSYITLVSVVAFCAGSDTSDSELDPEELREIEDIYRQYTGEDLSSPKELDSPSSSRMEFSTSQVGASASRSGPSGTLTLRINQYYENKFLTHLAGVTKANSYCVLNEQIYTHFRDILIGKSQSNDEISLALTCSKEQLIEEVLKQAPHLISRVPGKAMYTLTPEGFLIPKLNGVQEALDHTRLIPSQVRLMLELYNSVLMRSHSAPKVDENQNIDGNQKTDDNQIIIYKQNPKPEPINLKVLSSRTFPIEKKGLACLLPSSSSSSSSSESVNVLASHPLQKPFMSQFYLSSSRTKAQVVKDFPRNSTHQAEERGKGLQEVRERLLANANTVTTWKTLVDSLKSIGDSFKRGPFNE